MQYLLYFLCIIVLSFMFDFKAEKRITKTQFIFLYIFWFIVSTVILENGNIGFFAMLGLCIVALIIKSIVLALIRKKDV